MKVLVSTAELISNLKLNELSEPNKKLEKKFGEFSFVCGCGNVHSILKKKFNTPAFSNVFWSDPTHCVHAICQESSRILFACRHGFFTMVALRGGILKRTIETDFTIGREIVDSHEQGLGLFIPTARFNLDFNLYGERKFPLPVDELGSWKELEERITDTVFGPLEKMPTYNPELENFIFKCPCDNKRHNLVGNRGDFAFNQKFGGFHVAAFKTRNSYRMLTLCSNGFYCFIHVRPSLPVEWFFRCETFQFEGRSVPVLPREAGTSKLPTEIVGHMKFLHACALD